MSGAWQRDMREDLASCEQLHDDLVTAEAFAARFGYSVRRARTVLNVAADHGAIEKVRLRAAGIFRAGVWYAYRPIQPATEGPDHDRNTTPHP